MLEFKIDQEKCIQCGECVRDCPVRIIEMTEDECPVIIEDGEERCMRCQHCLAVCPTGALSIFGMAPEDSIPLKGNLPGPEQMEVLIKGRRSTRSFDSKPVEKALIDRMLEVVQHAPTAVNNGQVMLTVVDDKTVMDELRSRSLKIAEDIVDGRTKLPERLEMLKGYFEACRGGNDVIYRGAPHLLVVSSPRQSYSPREDCLIALSYFELLANSHGLGTVWDGFAKIVLTMIAPDLGKMLGIPDDHEIGYMMAFGHPAVKYHRTVQRPQGSINRVTLDD